MIYALWVPADGRYAFSETDNGGLELTVDERDALIAGERAGQRIAPGDDGRPSLQAAPAAVPVPLSCNAAQIRLALNTQGLRSAVEAAVAAGDQDLKDLWAFSPVFRETDANILGLATAIGKTAADVHDLFVLAITL